MKVKTGLRAPEHGGGHAGGAVVSLVFIDLETGGLDPKVHPITQIAAIATTDELEERESFECKVKFDVAKADAKALEINSFDAVTWEERGVNPYQAFELLGDFLRRHVSVEMMSRAGKPFKVAQLAGYNAATFDGPFLREWTKRLEEADGKRRFLPGHYRVLDVMQLALWTLRGVEPAPASFKQADVCAYFDIEYDAHDALEDIAACVALARRLEEINRNQEEKA